MRDGAENQIKLVGLILAVITLLIVYMSASLDSVHFFSNSLLFFPPEIRSSQTWKIDCE